LLPHDGWVGRWVTVSDVVQPVRYINHPAFSSGVGEASIHVDHLSQIRLIPGTEARFRLAGRHKTTPASTSSTEPTPAQATAPAPAPTVPQEPVAQPDPDGVLRPSMRPSTDSSARNRAILEKMRTSK
jgi:hypothetical protein